MNHQTSCMPARVNRKVVQARTECRTAAARAYYRARGHWRTRPGWVAVLIATLLAFMCQSFVTQTHEHYQPQAHLVVAGATGEVSHLKADRTPADPSDTCPICREMAQAGHYISSPPFVFFDREKFLHWLAITPALVLVVRLLCHSWQSRAPPPQL